MQGTGLLPKPCTLNPDPRVVSVIAVSQASRYLTPNLNMGSRMVGQEGWQCTSSAASSR